MLLEYRTLIPRTCMAAPCGAEIRKDRPPCGVRIRTYTFGCFAHLFSHVGSMYMTHMTSHCNAPEQLV